MKSNLDATRLHELEMDLHTKGMDSVTVRELVQNPGKYHRIWAYMRYILTGEREIMSEADERLDAYLARYLGD